MQHYLYLTIDFLSLLFPFAFSFYPKADFSKKWKYLIPALLAGAIPFISWDIYFTSLGIWSFNPKYISGIYLFNLPVEEALFFFCIPYACVFTYEAISFFFKKKIIADLTSNFISDVFIFGSLILGAVYNNRWYTSVTFFSLAIFMLALRRIWKVDYLGKFFFAFTFILIPFFFVNGILTGTGLDEPVVWYNNHENMGIRIGTIPLEDVFYGLLLLLINISVFEFLSSKNKKATD